jgi:hypothetical protein
MLLLGRCCLKFLATAKRAATSLLLAWHLLQVDHVGLTTRCTNDVREFDVSDSSLNSYAEPEPFGLPDRKGVSAAQTNS